MQEVCYRGVGRAGGAKGAGMQRSKREKEVVTQWSGSCLGPEPRSLHSQTAVAWLLLLLLLLEPYRCSWAGTQKPALRWCGQGLWYVQLPAVLHRCSLLLLLRLAHRPEAGKKVVSLFLPSSLQPWAESNWRPGPMGKGVLEVYSSRLSVLMLQSIGRASVAKEWCQ